MKKLTKKQKLAVRLTATYSLMVTAVVGIVAILILAVLGYQFNGKDGRVEQGGLLQFATNPSGAQIKIDTQPFGSQTPSRTTYAAGMHTINFDETGYQPWQKSVDLRAGTILWLNYARLIPAKVTTQTVQTLPKLGSALASSDQQTMAAISDSATPTITLYDISNESVKSSTVTLPDDISTPTIAGSAQTYTLKSWSDDSNHLLVQHDFVSDAGPQSEWLWVDTSTPKNSKNLNTVTGLQLTQARFSSGSSNQLYITSNGDLRRLDMGSGSISSPLATSVEEYHIADDGLVTYTTGPDPQRVRSVGYVSNGANAGHVIRSYTDDNVLPIHIATGIYYGQRYVATSYGDKIEVASADLPSSDSQSDVSLQSVQNITNPAGNVEYLSMRTNGRFLIAQTGATYTTYDLEVQKTSTTTLPNTEKVVQPLSWIDNYHVWSDLDGQLRLYEFDGQNPTIIMKVAPGFDATLSQNGKYLYAFTRTASGEYGLTRAKLLLN